MTIKHTLSILSHLGSNTLGCLLRDIGVRVSAVRQILAVFLLKLSLRAQGLSLPRLFPQLLLQSEHEPT